jgi:hypothetical protein
MTETCKIYDTIDDVSEWTEASQEGSRGFMDADLLNPTHRFWNALR